MHVHRNVSRTIAITLLAGCALLVWRLLTSDDCASCSFGVGMQDQADMRLWYPACSPSRLARVRAQLFLTPECPDAQVADAGQPFPVLLYFGGWPGTSINNVELIHSLVRSGFVVVARLYPPSAERPMDFSSNAAYQDTLLRAGTQVRALARDASALTDRVVALNAGRPESRFAGRLATSKIGIFGYSFGGAVAAQAAWSDPRISAALNIDGWSFGDAAIHGVRQPYLLISDDSAIPGPDDLVATDPVHRYTSILTKDDIDRSLHNLMLNGGLFVVLAGTGHGDFPDRGTASRLRDKLGLSVTHAGRVQQLLRAYTVAFFESVLRGADSPLLRGPSREYPEVRLESWKGTKEGGL
jgi:dienelactone hydrolase